jgi:RNA polymerase sigma-70 factor, ECF subfamily
MDVTTRETTSLWAEFHRPLRAFLARRTRREADVDDLLQEIFVRIHRRIESLERADRLDAWIFQIARNALVDFERGRATRLERSPEQGSPGEAALDPEEPQPSELAGCLGGMVGALPGPYEEAIRLTELEGLSVAQAAERAGVSRSAMKSRVRRGRARLKELLLGCCHVEVDARGGVMDYHSRCSSCTCGPEKGPAPSS